MIYMWTLLALDMDLGLYALNGGRAFIRTNPIDQPGGTYQMGELKARSW